MCAWYIVIVNLTTIEQYLLAITLVGIYFSIFWGLLYQYLIGPYHHVPLSCNRPATDL
jgi:hypothetical protein